MKDFDENDELWKLLGKAKKHSPPPFFARDILREIRASRMERFGFLPWLRMRWAIVSLAGVVAMLLALNVLQFIAPAHPRVPQVAVTLPVQSIPVSSAKADYEVIKNLDELVAYDEHSIWLDDPSE